MDVYRNTQVRVTDLVTEEQRPVIEGLVFESCLLTGPAIVLALNSQFFGCNFGMPDGAGLESILWPWPDSPIGSGCIGIVDCQFHRCVFRTIGWTGRSEQLAQMRVQMTAGQN